MTDVQQRQSALDGSWVRAADCDLAEFAALVEQETAAGDYPNAAEIQQNVPIYEAADLAQLLDSDRRGTLAELRRVLLGGPGLLVVRGLMEAAVVDRASAIFQQIIEAQNASGAEAGDHFAKPGANDRIWNSLEKHCLADPESFAEYMASPVLVGVCTAWLGPGYQMSAQVNVVNPGGEAQQPHRDYHLGFLEDDEAEDYPAMVHQLSPALTLQGAVAHCDMPVETGPTLYLPHSQKYVPGYVAWRRPDFKEYFAQHHRQLPLNKGDAAFFNPAVFHAAGTNRTSDVKRMANLFQVSSAFGRLLEAIDRKAMVEALYPVLLEWKAAGRSDDQIDAVIAASAEGYPFPANLDIKQPTGVLKPPSQAQLLRAALTSHIPVPDFTEESDD